MTGHHGSDADGNSKIRCVRISAPLYNYWQWKCLMMRCWLCETERKEVVLAWIFFQTEHKLLMPPSDFARRHNKQTKVLINHQTATASLNVDISKRKIFQVVCFLLPFLCMIKTSKVAKAGVHIANQHKIRSSPRTL